MISKFTSLKSITSKNIYKTYHALKKKHNAILGAFSITIEEYFILDYLKDTKNFPISPSVMLENLNNPDINLSRLIDNLNCKGLLVRQQCKVDRRMLEVSILQKGIDLLDEISKYEFEFFERSSKLYKTYKNAVTEPSFETIDSEFQEKDAVELNSLLELLRNN